MLAIGCCTINVSRNRNSSTYSSIDKDLRPYYDSYFEDARVYGIHFEGTVTSGFTNINQGSIIGLCSKTPTYRQIDVDRVWWGKASSASKHTLMNHELTHCYCGRTHDYAEGKPYQKYDPNQLAWNNKIQSFIIQVSLIKAGFYPDGCPLSIMNPEIPEDDCVRAHNAEYTKEMFDRCEAY